MRHLRLTTGTPDEPDDDDLDAICAGPRPGGFFSLLFKEVAGFSLPAPVVTRETEDDIRRTRTGWQGDEKLGLEVTVVECTETTAFPTYVYYETHGLPGMTVKWNYELHYKGQLGHVVYRHGGVECTFDGDADQRRFGDLWRRGIGKDPGFEPITDPRT